MANQASIILLSTTIESCVYDAQRESDRLMHSQRLTALNLAIPNKTHQPFSSDGITRDLSPWTTESPNHSNSCSASSECDNNNSNNCNSCSAVPSSYTLSHQQLRHIGRSVFVRVELDIIAKNFQLLKNLCRNQSTLVVGVVKGNAYAHGAVAVSKYLRSVGVVDRLAVANVPEAVQLRRAGVMGVIHVLGNVQAWEMPECLRYSLVPTVTSVESVRGMAEAMKQCEEEQQAWEKLQPCCWQPHHCYLCNAHQQQQQHQWKEQHLQSPHVQKQCQQQQQPQQHQQHLQQWQQLDEQQHVRHGQQHHNGVDVKLNNVHECGLEACCSKTAVTMKRILHPTDKTTSTGVDEVNSLPVGTVHIKVDTGMSRNGCQPPELPNLVEECHRVGVPLEGIFSHISNHEDVEYSTLQLDRFNVCVQPYRNDGYLFHIANSGAVLYDIGTDMDLIRPGISAYGMPSGPDLQAFISLGFRPALSVKCVPTLVKRCPRGTKIGYACAYASPRDEWIATFPIGYADGYWRELGETGSQYIIRDRTGERCPVVGRVSMDAITVRVPERPIAGELFTLITADFDPVTSVTGISETLGTIQNEVLIRLSNRLPRVYSTASNPWYCVWPALDQDRSVTECA